MVIEPGPDLEAALSELAHQRGVTAEALVLDILRERLPATILPIEPQDEWERRLLGIAIDCGCLCPTRP